MGGTSGKKREEKRREFSSRGKKTKEGIEGKKREEK